MSQVYSMEVAGLQVVPLPPSFPLQIHRSALKLVEPSIAPSSINDLKTTEVPLVLRVQGSPLVSMVPVSPPDPMVIAETVASQTAYRYRDFTSDWSSRAAIDSRDIDFKLLPLCNALVEYRKTKTAPVKQCLQQLNK
jgi:hypothetical protein